MKLLTGTEVLIADSVMIICSYSLVVARLWFRLVHQRLSLSISDICLLVACAELLALFMILIKEHKLGAMKPGYIHSSEIRKLSFAAVLLYDTCIYVLKFGFLAFYLKLFPVGMVKLRRALYATIVLTGLSGLIAVLMAIFWCGPNISKQFDVTNVAEGCSYWNENLVLGDWIMNFLSDVLIFALPFPLLRQLALNRRQVFGLFVTFGLGILIIVVSICRFVTVRQHKFLPLYVWSVAEICTSIMVVSLPALRPLLRKGSNIFNGSKRRTPQHILPMQEPPTSPAVVRPQSIFMRSKTEPSTGRNEPPEGYSYNYETRSLDGSDVELHGALSSEINQKDNSRVQTIAVYTDVNDVIDRISEEERRKHATEGSALKENEDWEQQQLQLEQYQIQQHQLQQHEQQPQQQQQQEYQQQLPPKQ